jgi:hypothetical protein
MIDGTQLEASFVVKEDDSCSLFVIYPRLISCTLALEKGVP